MSSSEPASVESPPKVEEAPSVEQALWEAVDEKWEEPAVHDAFLNACAEANNLAFAAGKYRSVKEGEDEGRRELAEERLRKITAMALAQMAAMKSPPQDHKRGVTILAALVSAALIAACVYLLTLWQ